MLASGTTSAFYEAPGRIHATLATLATLDATRRIFLVRELTKRFEQQLLGTGADIASALESPVRGEIAFVIEAAARPSVVHASADIDAQIDEALARGLPTATIARDLARRGFGARAELYRRTIELRSKPRTQA
ncbi:MAG: hypothetical protein NVS2B3_18090 [Vulcanimicrobiaceae bacterium]